MSAHDYSGNVARFTGFADLYDRHRPSPPEALALLVSQVTGFVRPALVVDLGSGTGLSTRYWADKADRVVGVEPSADMRRQAEAATPLPQVSYREGLSHTTGLPDACAQVVVCMQALHWMDPDGTYAEAARLLTPEGAFVACDYDWPPKSGSWDADTAFAACIKSARRLEQEHRVADNVRHWDKSGHYARMQACGRFRHVLERTLYHRDTGNAERLVALLLSQGYVVALRKAGVSDEAIGLPVLRQAAAATIGQDPRPFLWTARVRIGIV